MADQIVISGEGQDSLLTGAQKINLAIAELNQAILDLALKIVNAGDVPSIQAGLIANRPEATGSGAIYIATDEDEKKFYRDVAADTWELIGGGQVDWSSIEGKPSTFPPSAHAASHASGQADAITPASIGALASALFTWANLGGKPSTFTPSAHKTTHSTGGSDALTAANIGAITLSDLIWANIAGKPSTYPPSAHAASHASGQADAITPAAIGAMPASTVFPFCANCQSTNLNNADEVWFFEVTVPTGKTLKIKATNVYPAGITNMICEVWNVTDSQSVYSSNSSWSAGNPLATVAADKVVAFRLKNTSGANRSEATGFVAFTIE